MTGWWELGAKREGFRVFGEGGWGLCCLWLVIGFRFWSGTGGFGSMEVGILDSGCWRSVSEQLSLSCGRHSLLAIHDYPNRESLGSFNAES